jgi:hypothetical protein
LEAKKDRLKNKMEEINARLRNIDENGNEVVAAPVAVLDAQPQVNTIQCVCGAPLIRVNPSEAYYNGATVHCDICGKRCPSDESVFHCPQDKHQTHPEGYDLCCNCVDFQMTSFIKQQQEQQQQQQKNQNALVKKDSFDRAVKSGVAVATQAVKNVKGVLNNFFNNGANDMQAPLLPVQEQDEVQMVGEEEKNQDLVENNVVNGEDDVVVIPPDDNEPVLNDVNPNANNHAEADGEKDPDAFDFPEQLQNILTMGFEHVDVPTVKFLLIKHKGDVNRVINQLVQP